VTAWPILEPLSPGWLSQPDGSRSVSVDFFVRLLAGDPRLALDQRQLDRSRFRVPANLVGQLPRMGRDENLRASPRAGNEAAERRQKLWVEAGLGFIEGQELWRPRGEESGHEAEVAECAIRQFVRLERPPDPWHLHPESDALQLVRLDQ